MYRLKTTTAAEHDIRGLWRVLRRDFESLRSVIAGLASDPRPRGVKKIKGREHSYRVRVGTYRIIYEVYDDDKLVIILRVIRRSETTYR